MDLLFDILKDALFDTAKLVPFLFVTYLAMEAIEHKAGERSRSLIRRAGFAGPVIGAVLGAFPQCGFSAAAATLYAGRVVTLGTLVAVFLSTSDEMLPIFIAEQVDIGIILQIVGLKVVVGLAAGFLIDGVLRLLRRTGEGGLQIHELCEQEGCACAEEDGGIVQGALRHTVQVSVFIFAITLVLGAAIELVGENALAGFLSANPVLSVFASALVGLIPNCGASVVVTQLYLEGALGTGAMMAGLLVAAGVGLLVLFRTNRRLRENLAIVAMLYGIGVVCGIVIDVLGISF